MGFSRFFVMREEPRYFKPERSIFELGNKNYLVLLKAKGAQRDPDDNRIIEFGNALLIKRNICGAWVTKTHIYVTYLTSSPDYFRNKQLLAEELPKEAIPVPIDMIFSWEAEL